MLLGAQNASGERRQALGVLALGTQARRRRAGQAAAARGAGGSGTRGRRQQRAAGARGEQKARGHGSVVARGRRWGARQALWRARRLTGRPVHA